MSMFNVQVFDTHGSHKATWLSRVSTQMPRETFSRHVSSISYHEALDVFVLTCVLPATSSLPNPKLTGLCARAAARVTPS